MSQKMRNRKYKIPRYKVERKMKKVYRRPKAKPKLPYLLPECPLEYARGLYQGEGSAFCIIDEKNKRARFGADIGLYDKEALDPVSPCFGVKPRPDPRRGYVLERRGKPALNIAKALSTTPTRKKQIEDALKRCREHWQKGYRDQIQE